MDEQAMDGTYQKLADEFEWTFHDTRGGAELDYVTGEQVVSRLNAVLGWDGWSWIVISKEYDEGADEYLVHGRLTVHATDGRPHEIVREAFGSQKAKRSRATNVELDLGFDCKGAATDALKKAATLIGVGLYLSRKPKPSTRAAAPQQNGSAPEAGAQQAPARAGNTSGALCEDCGAELTETRFKDGTAWPPAQLAGYGRRKHGKVLCMEHYRAANEARKAALAEAS